ncbi:MAG TPA: guanylate kinase [candidate division WOR-3 bacterium]|uniref:Guanylate kinase n=1 Tax=candidate division WOR-3 bacterium TaxID=2052148 RepID=A0A7V0XF79_UNCW3|nr:guanylate kinase [candidate division WOR-3 bacterium]
MSSSRPDHRPFLVVLSSPSGAGKTSICREVVRLDRQVAYSVSATTRPRRPGEVHGRSYWFYTEPQFRDRVRRGGFIEHARVYDHWYGTPRAHVAARFREGRDVIADLDIQGMLSAKKALPGTVGIFITVPDRRELARRLRNRGTDSTEVIRRREAELKAELAAIPHFDYIVTNDRLERATADVLAIIRAERCRVGRRRAQRKRQ